MPDLTKPAAHPRLLATSAQLQQLARPPQTRSLQKASAEVKKLAEEYLRDPEVHYNPRLHNSLLLRAREMQKRLVTLLVRWIQTGDERFRGSALRDIRTMAQWEFWSWNASLAKNSDPKADFDLACGENSATLALAYDWLHATLSVEEKRPFREMARKRVFEPFLAHTAKAKPAWWFGNHQSNWNTVCAGGAGMVALAFLDEIPEANLVLKRADFSIASYMKSLEATMGGWPEGIGYWNYGHRYAFWYLLSHEHCTGQKHPLLQLKGTKKTLRFPLDFCPHGQPCSFGDVNLWSPIPFHYAAAIRLKCPEIIPQLDLQSKNSAVPSEDPWPNAAELLIFHPGKQPEKGIPKNDPAPSPALNFYPGMEWGTLADRFPNPKFYLSVRGGKTGWEVPHSHQDLGSFQCVVGNERLIDNPGADGGSEYLDTTFSNRRYELFETTPASKNVILLNGVGINNPAASQTTQLSGPGWKAFRVDITGSIWWHDPSSVPFCARLFLFLQESVALIIDRVELKNSGRVETRFHSFSEISRQEMSATVQGKRSTLTLAFGSDIPVSLYQHEAALTTPGKTCSALRLCSNERTHTQATLVALLVPGKQKAGVEVQRNDGKIQLKIRAGSRTKTLEISDDLLKIE